MISCALIFLFLLVWTHLQTAVLSLSITASKSGDNAIVGNNPFTVSCQYTIEPNEQLYNIEVQRKRDSEITGFFQTIVTFQNPSSSINVVYQDTSLEDRTVATKPTDESKTATLVFKRIELTDEGTYKCKAFYTDGTLKTAEASVNMLVKGLTTTQAPATTQQTVAGHTEVTHFSQQILQGKIDSAELDEASGLAASRLHPDILYSHNDHGDRPRLFAINASTAEVVAVLDISAAHNNDWEDVAVGPCSKEDQRTCIYILDDGNHNGVYKRTIYRVVEPNTMVSQTIAPVSTYKYNWTQTAAATIMVDINADVYVIGTTLGGHSKMAKLPAQAWGQTVPVYIDSGSYFSMPTSHHHDPQGGDISKDGTEVIVKTKNNIYYWKLLNGDIISALTHPGVMIPYHKERVGEAVCWSADGSAYYTLGEGLHQNLYKYERA